MISKETIAYMRLVHGSYNIMLMLLFVYQGSLGLRIRKVRTSGMTSGFNIIKKHRYNGPILALLGVIGFFAGAILVYIDKGHLLKYPLHLTVGIVIVFSITAAFFVSRMIKGSDSPWRTRHFVLGLFIICLYLVQVFLGLNILL